MGKINLLHIAIQNVNGNEQDKLSFQKGEIFEIIDDATTDGWWPVRKNGIGQEVVEYLVKIVSSEFQP